MDSELIECDLAERDTELCGPRAGPTLAVLQDVQRAYEERMEIIEKMPASKKVQMQVEVLRSWVGDLVAQNSLLARAVQELEAEATMQLCRERRRHSEMALELRAELAALRRRLARKDSDLRGLLEVLRRLREFDNCTTHGIHFFELSETDIFGDLGMRKKKLDQGDTHISKQDTTRSNRHRRLEKKTACGNISELKHMNESLYKENIAKEREIRKLNKDVQQYEQTILSLRNEISSAKYHTPDVSQKDAELAGPERGDWEPVREASAAAALRADVLSYQERIQKVEAKLKCSGVDVRALRSSNVALREECVGLRAVCAALAQQCRTHALRDQFKDDIIREMRRQLKQAKAKSREVSEVLSRSGSQKSRDSRHRSPARCVRDQPRRSLSDDCLSPRLELSREDLLPLLPD